MFSFGKKSLSNLKGVHPHLVAVIVIALKKSSVDFTVDFGVRTAAQQYELWLQGRNAATGKVVDASKVVTKRDGYKVISNHQAKEDGFGYAVDIYPYINGKVDYADQYGKTAAIAKVIKFEAEKLGFNIVWGGSWSVEKEGLVDKPHFELR